MQFANQKSGLHVLQALSKSLNISVYLWTRVCQNLFLNDRKSVQLNIFCFISRWQLDTQSSHPLTTHQLEIKIIHSIKGIGEKWKAKYQLSCHRDFGQSALWAQGVLQGPEKAGHNIKAVKRWLGQSSAGNLNYTMSSSVLVLFSYLGDFQDLPRSHPSSSQTTS